MDLVKLNFVFLIGTFILSVTGAIMALYALVNRQTAIPARYAAISTALAALFALISCFTGITLRNVSAATIAALEKEMAVPDLSESQIATLTQSLASVPKPADPVHLMAISNRESANLAKKIKQALQAAGFAVDGVWEDVVLAGPGPSIVIRQTAKNGPVGIGFAAALKKVGLASRITAIDGLPESRVEIAVDFQP